MPFYENLRIKDFKEFIDEHQGTSDYFPDGKEFNYLPRGYIANVIFSLHAETFKNWVSERIDYRNEVIKKEQNNLIYLLPEVADFIKASQDVPCKCITFIFLYFLHHFDFFAFILLAK